MEKVDITIEFCIFELVYNLGHNILELYDVLVQVQSATSKATHDVYYNKLGIRNNPRVTERLKTLDLRKLGNIRKISNLG